MLHCGTHTWIQDQAENVSHTQLFWLISLDLNFFQFKTPEVRAGVMSNTTQRTEEQRRERDNKFRTVSLFPVCKCPNLDEPDYLGTRHYRAECHPTQQCMAEDSKSWQKTWNSLSLLCHRIPHFYVMLVRQKAGQLLLRRSLFKSHKVYSYVGAEDILLLMLEKRAGSKC